MPRHQRVSTMARANEAHFCDVSGCTEHRTSLSHYCARHRANLFRNGHPTGAPIASTQWAPYRTKVRDVYLANSTHPGLTRALEWLRAWMAEAVERDGLKPWATEVARLHRYGCSPLDVLVELASAFAFLELHPRTTLSDSHRDFALSKAVLGLAPRPRVVTPQAVAQGNNGYAPKAKPAALKHIGPHLVQALGPLLVNTLRSLQAEEEQAQSAVEAMRQPFQLTPKAITRAASQATTSMKDQ